MITGDKLETAENIGLMSGIVTDKMKTFYIKDVDKDTFYVKGR
jgi:magnesium-transporting ATPase (P-type)